MVYYGADWSFVFFYGCSFFGKCYITSASSVLSLFEPDYLFVVAALIYGGFVCCFGERFCSLDLLLSVCLYTFLSSFLSFAAFLWLPIKEALGYACCELVFCCVLFLKNRSFEEIFLFQEFFEICVCFVNAGIHIKNWV